MKKCLKEETAVIEAAQTVAEYFIHLANVTGSYISNMKLQKLVYYAQAWHLALKDKPLFPEDFEAWIHGPVLPSLYHNYKQFGWKPIQKEVEEPKFSEELSSFLEELSTVYFACDAYELELMTHREDPWIAARGGLPPDERCTAQISKESMCRYYKSLAEE
jgi:uncharacterized phage-associated protein